MRRTAWAVACLLVVPQLVLPVRVVQSQPTQWLVLPAAPGEIAAGGGSPAAAAAALESSFPAQVDTVSSARAAEIFERRGSTPPVMVKHSDLEALARDAQQALYHVASGMPARARKDVERALSRADRVLVSLNRQTRAAEQLLDACLYLVRAYLQSHKRTQARVQALECRRLVPDIQPNATMHPPAVLKTLSRAEAEHRKIGLGKLRVESVPDGCAVYVNGRQLGRAPLELQELGQGEYRVQSECLEGAFGRVHHIDVGDDGASLRIDTRFEAAVRTSGGLRLRYDDLGKLRRMAPAHAAMVGRVVGLDDVVLVVPLAGATGRIPGIEEDYATSGSPDASERGDLEALRVRTHDAVVVGRVRFRIRAGQEMAATQASAVGEALLAGRFVDLRGGRPAVLRAAGGPKASSEASGAPDPEDAAPEAERGEAKPDADGGQRVQSGREDGWVVPAMWVAGIAGTAAIATGWGLWGYQMSLEQAYRDALGGADGGLPELNALEDLEFIPLGVASAGSLMASAALPWLLPDADPVPAAAWLAGLVGTAGLGVGVALAVHGAGCDVGDSNDRCSDVLATTRMGGLMIATSLPLLVTPLVFLARGGGTTQENVGLMSPRLAIWSEGAYLGIAGSL